MDRYYRHKTENILPSSSETFTTAHSSKAADLQPDKLTFPGTIQVWMRIRVQTSEGGYFEGDYTQ
jgi:hypothetical protein